MTEFAQRRTMMVDTQVRPNDVTSYPVIEAMLNIPREAFVPATMRDVAYVGENIAIGHGRELLAPRTIGLILETLELKNSDLVLDVGCGYGYAAACAARVAEAVVAIDDIPDFTTEAQQRLTDQGIFNVAVAQARLTEGWPGQAPYDAMMIGGAIEVFPDTLADQLRDGGRVVAIFKEGNLGIARIGRKIDGRINWRLAFNASAPVLPDFSRVPGFAL